MNDFNNYFGVFNCYYPGRGMVRTLIMAGVFSVDDIFRVNKLLVKEGIGGQHKMDQNHNSEYIKGVNKQNQKVTRL